MTNDDGTPAPLIGTCKKCSRPLDDHRFRVNGQLGMEPVCPQPNEKWAGGPLKGEKS